MTTCVTGIASETPLPNGQKLVTGTFTFSANYYANGDTLDLSNVFLDDSVPMVMCGQAAGYTAFHNQGNAKVGKVLAYCGAAGASATLGQANTNSDLSSINVGFIAIGQAY